LWHRKAVGGGWEEIGRWQFDLMKSLGLLPSHYFLDVGCGSFRGGVYFIDYLDEGHYFGIEKEFDVLAAGEREELSPLGLMSKRPLYLSCDNFDLSWVPPNINFDFVLAQSVFSHVGVAIIDHCFHRVVPKLAPGGRFVATYFEAKGDKWIKSLGTHHWRKNEYYAIYYSPQVIDRLASAHGLVMETVEDANHPRGLSTVMFTLAGS
jgi:cyclopropane fatty-acyl-phospholipid synthase-like methyltransferase